MDTHKLIKEAALRINSASTSAKEKTFLIDLLKEDNEKNLNEFLTCMVKRKFFSKGTTYRINKTQGENAYAWVSQAVGKKDDPTRSYLRHTWCLKQNDGKLALIASDAHRVHCVFAPKKPGKGAVSIDDHAKPVTGIDGALDTSFEMPKKNVSGQLENIRDAFLKVTLPNGKTFAKIKEESKPLNMANVRYDVAGKLLTAKIDDTMTVDAVYLMEALDYAVHGEIRYLMESPKGFALKRLWLFPASQPARVACIMPLYV